MDLLRWALLAGMILHKIVWEVLRRKGRAAGVIAPRSYRPLSLLVKAVKLAVLGALIYQTLYLDVLPILPDPLVLRVTGAALFVLGLSVALAGRVQLGRNWSDLEDAEIRPDQQLVTGGIFSVIRHPIYAGDVLLLVGLQLALNSWLVAVALAPMALVVRQALIEEKLLAAAFPEYADYRARTKRFIPFVV